MPFTTTTMMTMIAPMGVLRSKIFWKNPIILVQLIPHEYPSNVMAANKPCARLAYWDAAAKTTAANRQTTTVPAIIVVVGARTLPQPLVFQVIPPPPPPRRPRNLSNPIPIPPRTISPPLPLLALPAAQKIATYKKRHEMRMCASPAAILRFSCRAKKTLPEHESLWDCTFFDPLLLSSFEKFHSMPYPLVK